ncbi:beta strand repeat-containing protein [Curtobacterium pusillum]|uniref:beta strand repeat-containing protein n=1 Tax=Curtobacterium pusillum TaxID=69373 RepID=UPI0011A58799|nr:tandem-95 repeat protein [Curtobacterium pusillum]
MPPKHRGRFRTPRLPLLAGFTVAALAVGSAAFVAPQTASAAAPFLTTAIYGTVSGSSNVVSIDRTTGNETTVLTEPTGATGLNQLGFSNDGGQLFMTNATNVYEYTASTGAWTVTARSTGAAVANQMGGVDPTTGKYWFGGFVTNSGNQFSYTSYDPTTNTIAATATTITAATPPGGNGDLAFDRLGNMYFISSSAAANGNPASAQVYRVDAADLGRANATATQVGPAIAPPAALTSLAFGDDGYLYIAGSGANGFLKVDPVTGSIIDRRTPSATLTDMGTRQYPSTGQATTSLPEGRKDADDQFTVSVGGGDVPKPATASTSGTGTSATAGPIILLPGKPYTATQTPANSTTNAADYSTTYTCTDLSNGDVVSKGSGSTANFTVPTTNGSNVACTFANPIAGPAAQDDASRGNRPGQAVTVDVLANDTGDVDPTTVQLVAPASVSGAVLSSDGRTLTVPGEGVHRVDATTGAVTFTPDAALTGNPTPIGYTVADTRGKRGSATLTVTYAGAANADTASTSQGKAVDVDVLGNDRGTDPTSVVFPAAGQPSGATVSADGRTLTVPGQGSYTADPSTGVVTYTPDPAFRGTTSPITYQVADTDGTPTTATVTVAVSAVGPKAADDIATTGENAAVTVDVTANDAPGVAGGTPIDPTTVVFPTSGQPTGATVATDGRSITVPGRGTFVADPTTGTVTFTPVAGYTGDVDPVAYQVADRGGRTDTATIAVTVNAVAPKAVSDTATTTQGKRVTVDVLGNDEPGNAQTPIDPTTVTFTTPGQPAGATVSSDGRTLTVPGDGVYTIDPATGAVTFAPDPALRGAATPITYAVSDSDRNTSVATVTVTATPVGPKVGDDTTTTEQNTPVTADVTANDRPGVEDGTPIDPTTVVFPAAGQPTGAAVSDGGRTLTVPSEGTYTADPTTGKVTYTPAAGFTGPTTPVTYQVADQGGQTGTGTIGATVTKVSPTATDDTAATSQGTTVRVDVLDDDRPGNAATPLDPTTVVFPAAGQPADATVSDGGRTLTVPGQGVYRADPSTGAVTCTPEPAFRGDAKPVTYQVSDVDGTPATATLTVTVSPVSPHAVDDTATTQQNTAVAIPVTANDEPGVEGGTPIDPSTVRFPVGGQPKGSTVSDSGRTITITVPDQGAFVVDPSSGVVTFTPTAGFTGTTTPVTYQVRDTGRAAATATITVTVSPVSPTAQPDTATTSQGTAVTVDPLADDTAGNTRTPLDPASVRFPTAGQPSDVTVSDGARTLTVPAQGVWTIDPESGAITFTPEPAFRGTTAPVTYQVSDVDGTSSSSTVTVTVTAVGPRAADDARTTTQNTPVRFDPLANDAPGVRGGTPLDPTTVVFPTAGQPDGVLVTDGGKTLTVPGQGVLRIDPTTGAVTFTPAARWSGTTPAVVYQVSDTGAQTATATITVTVDPVVPTARPDTATTAARTPVTVDPLGNDVAGNTATPLDPTSVRLLDAAGAPVTSLPIAGKGTFTVDATTGRITFTPVDGFTGPVSAPYQVTDGDGSTARSTVTVTVGTPPKAVSDHRTTATGTPVTVDVTGNDSSGSTALVASSVRLVDPETGALVTTVTIAGQGTFRVGVDGRITFTPATGFAGTSTVTYSVADADGSRSTADLSVTVPAAAGIAPNPGPGGGVVVTTPSGRRLAFTGTDLVVPGGIAALLLLAAGAGLLAVRRRRWLGED